MILLLVILVPLVGVLAVPVKASNRMLYYLILSSLALINITLLSFHIATNEVLHIYGFIYFFLDKFSWFFALLINVMWLITTIYSYSFTAYHFQDKTKKFFIFFNIVVSVLLANVLAGNAPTMFLFYILGVPLTYPLITIRANTKEIGRYYVLNILLPAFLMFLPAIFIVYEITGEFNFFEEPNTALQDYPVIAAVCLVLFVLGISKNSVIPFHTWLPKTMIAPAPVSAFIHSIAAVKSGAIVLTKTAVYIYGLEFLQTLTSNFWTGGWLIYLCGITAVYTSFKALRANDLKVRFSYSTIGQISYILIAILIATPTAIVAAMLHIITHSIAKSGLFYVAGTYNSLYKTLMTNDIAKIAPHTKWLAVAVAIFGASITGFPFLAGFHSKDMMLLEELHTGHYAAAGFLLFGSIVNVLYIWPIVKSAFFYKEKLPIETHPIPIGMKVAIIICSVITVSFSAYSFYIIDYFKI
ncbi:proton-conducting transporter membrane subunit [Imperialibacter roseus]|uniref:Proton-conducting transporter membrane subunit n=1 Tax=Imperialibacter roseus TaxID=1324217 RepID=A0ABZ0IVT6_9BACT|nr:proton-conducting transporter membrane subunit [Imperialibacter roseus]WOK09163.1 proton-conducting transporter membrane subunit [Imperialibacter roseus]